MGIPVLQISNFSALAHMLLLQLMLAGIAYGAEPQDPSGTYLTGDGRARVRLEKCGTAGDRLCGYVVWLKVPLNDKGEPRIDFKNPDPKKQARPSLGHQLILGLKPNADAHYEGKIYNSEDGKSYDVTIWTETPGELTVRASLIGFLTTSQTWTKVSDLAPGQLPGPTNGANGPRSDPEYATAAPKPTAKAIAKSTPPPPVPAPEPTASIHHSRSAPTRDLGSHDGNTASDVLFPVWSTTNSSEMPPRDVAAYGIVAFPSLPIADQRQRYLDVCNSMKSTLLDKDAVSGILNKQQMITFWPTRSRSRSDVSSINCENLIDEYDLKSSLDAIRDADRQKKGLAERRGPFLIAWSPSESRTRPDA